jgi:8-oxo-dGTP pyrophosphatase MutT (NUDIX family)
MTLVRVDLSSQELFNLLAKRLKNPLPGIAAQSHMIPIPRPGHRDIHALDGDYIEAGVLILLYPGTRRLNVLLTKRTDRVFHHRDQISFPGGRREPHETLEDTALREAQEELGINLKTAQVLGRLTPLFIPPSKYCVYPFVAVVGERPDFQPYSEEVAEVIEIPLDHLLDEENVRREVWTIRGVKVEVPFYEYGDHKIWGATAMVLSEFLYLWKIISGL